MAKKKRTAARCAVNTKYQQKAQEAARGEREKQERRAEAVRKNTALSNAYLYGILIVFAAAGLYMLIRILFTPAKSIQALRSDLLLLSIAILPYLIIAAALGFRRLNKKRRESYSDRAKRLSGVLFLLILMAAVFLFAGQLYTGRTAGENDAVYSGTVAALEQSGLSVSSEEEAVGMRTLLEYSLQGKLRCGESRVVLNEHSSPYGWVVKRFDAQADLDYAAFPCATDNDVQIWGPMGDHESARAAVVKRNGNSILIWELEGPGEELHQLIPLLSAVGN